MKALIVVTVLVSALWGGVYLGRNCIVQTAGTCLQR